MSLPKRLAGLFFFFAVSGVLHYEIVAAEKVTLCGSMLGLSIKSTQSGSVTCKATSDSNKEFTGRMCFPTNLIGDKADVTRVRPALIVFNGPEHPKAISISGSVQVDAGVLVAGNFLAVGDVSDTPLFERDQHIINLRFDGKSSGWTVLSPNNPTQIENLTNCSFTSSPASSPSH